MDFNQVTFGYGANTWGPGVESGLYRAIAEGVQATSQHLDWYKGEHVGSEPSQTELPGETK
jgi:hypothetical protein